MGDKINAGIYVLSPRVLDRIELRPTSIEKETFPLIARDAALFAFTLPGYWMDVGQPKDYLTGAPARAPVWARALPARAARPRCLGLSDSGITGWPRRRRARARPAGLQLHLASLRRKAPAQLAHGPEIEGNVILHPSAKIGRDCKIGPNVSIGIECVIEDGARISNSVLLHRVKARPSLCACLCLCPCRGASGRSRPRACTSAGACCARK